MHKIYQEDIDGDGVGDLCLANLDGDDLPDSLDACPRNKIIQNTDFRYPINDYDYVRVFKGFGINDPGLNYHKLRVLA